MLPNVYDHSSFSGFLSAYIKQRKNLDKAFSFRNLSRRMGLTSPSTLAMVASGKRTPSVKLLHRFAEAVRLSRKEVEYAEALLSLQRASNERERDLYTERLRQLRPGGDMVVISLDQFEFIANWYHVAILEMASLADFKADAEWISIRLGGLVTPRQVTQAVERLLRLNLLKREADGSLTKTSTGFKSPSGIPNDAVRKFHREMLGLATKALDGQPVDERSFYGQTMTIAKDQLPEARKLFQDFLERMRSLMPKEGGDETYHLGLQFFRLTQKPQKAAPAATIPPPTEH